MTKDYPDDLSSPFFRIIALALIEGFFSHVVPFLMVLLAIVSIFAIIIMVLGFGESTATYGRPESILRALIAMSGAWLVTITSRWIGSKINAFTRRIDQS